MLKRRSWGGRGGGWGWGARLGCPTVGLCCLITPLARSFALGNEGIRVRLLTMSLGVSSSTVFLACFGCLLVMVPWGRGSQLTTPSRFTIFYDRLIHRIYRALQVSMIISEALHVFHLHFSSVHSVLAEEMMSLLSLQRRKKWTLM
jgi:hypothetical protein